MTNQEKPDKTGKTAHVWRCGGVARALSRAHPVFSESDPRTSRPTPYSFGRGPKYPGRGAPARRYSSWLDCRRAFVGPRLALSREEPAPSSAPSPTALWTLACSGGSTGRRVARLARQYSLDASLHSGASAIPVMISIQAVSLPDESDTPAITTDDGQQLDAYPSPAVRTRHANAHSVRSSAPATLAARYIGVRDIPAQLGGEPVTLLGLLGGWHEVDCCVQQQGWSRKDDPAL